MNNTTKNITTDDVYGFIQKKTMTRGKPSLAKTKISEMRLKALKFLMRAEELEKEGSK